MKQLALSWKLLLNVHSDSKVWPPPITRDGEFTWCILYQIRLATGSTFPLVSVEWYNWQRAGGWGGYERSISSIQKHEKCLPHVTVPAKPEICINWIEKFCMACSGQSRVIALRYRTPCSYSETQKTLLSFRGLPILSGVFDSVIGRCQSSRCVSFDFSR